MSSQAAHEYLVAVCVIRCLLECKGSAVVHVVHELVRVLADERFMRGVLLHLFDGRVLMLLASAG